MIKKKIGLILLIVGALIVVFGFVYDVMFAGIPYQDPTPELTQKYVYNVSIAYAFYKAGFIVSITGILVILFQRLYRRLLKKTK